VLNAANEVAVAAFLERRIRFDQIHQVNAAHPGGACLPDATTSAGSVEGLIARDARVRRAAVKLRCEPAFRDDQ
jgi:1-deoxy-D-xylulose-5-phosphate reductoisomerase